MKPNQTKPAPTATPGRALINFKVTGPESYSFHLEKFRQVKEEAIVALGSSPVAKQLASAGAELEREYIGSTITSRALTLDALEARAELIESWALTLDAVEPVAPRIKDGIHYGSEPIGMSVFDHKKDEIVAGCDFTKPEWQKIKSFAAALDASVGAILKAAVMIGCKSVEIEVGKKLIASHRQRHAARRKAAQRA